MQQDFFNAQPKNKVGADVQPNFFSSGEPWFVLISTKESIFVH